MALVFQYGSNLSEGRLNSAERLNGSAKKIGIVYTTLNYELDFNIWSKTNKCAVANLIPSKGRRIWGLLYSIPDDKVFREKCKKDANCLDKIEGEGYTYKRDIIRVAFPEGQKVNDIVITYFGIHGRMGLKTSTEYVTNIINGLITNEIPQDYVNYVIERIRLNNSEILLDRVLPLK